MVYIKIDDGLFVNKVTFFNLDGGPDRVVHAYGKHMARLVKVVRALAWFFTGGYCCNTKLVRIPGKGIHYLYEKALVEQMLAAGEKAPSSLDQESLKKMIQVVERKPSIPGQPGV